MRDLGFISLFGCVLFFLFFKVLEYGFFIIVLFLSFKFWLMYS